MASKSSVTRSSTRLNFMNIKEFLRIESDYHRSTEDTLNQLRTVFPMNDASKPMILRKADEQCEKQRKMIELLVQSEQE